MHVQAIADEMGTGVVDIYPQSHAEEFLAGDLPAQLGLGPSRREGFEFLASVQNGMCMDIMAMIDFEMYDLGVDVDVRAPQLRNPA